MGFNGDSCPCRLIASHQRQRDDKATAASDTLAGHRDVAPMGRVVFDEPALHENLGLRFGETFVFMRNDPVKISPINGRLLLANVHEDSGHEAMETSCTS